ncbi:amidohydrolase [Arthrobacter sp. AK01]|uniref:amidohydrolase n=1 Tax=Micrococcaceae TaxID=1268 RepID=UPI001E50B7BB|nr:MULTISPECIES: amidohydrolase [Micrococcaceae]MCD4849462.1 amidohydrolase [Arthrobacter sp. AK01]MCP1410961.1 cytosine deaminase [Paenarthrobacter sp. A20]
MTDKKFTLRNVRPWGAEAADITISGGVITEVALAGGTFDAGDLDGGGLLAVPGFINAHAHVDKSWWGKPWVSYTYSDHPTVEGWIANERAERGNYDIPNVNSAVAVLREFLRHGTTATRTHIDVDLGIGLKGLETVQAAVAELDGAIQVETVAFPQDGVLRRPGVLRLLDEAAQAGADAIGGLDPGTIDGDVEGQLDGLFQIAVERGVGLDLHLHDFGSLGAYEYRQVIRRTIDAGLQGRVNISHGFAMGSLQKGVQEEIIEGLAEAGISWTTVAMSGTAPLPWQQLRDRGVPLGLGTDGIRDLWSPFGDGDLLRVAFAFARLHGFRHDDKLTNAVEYATKYGAPFVGREQHDLVAGAHADIVLLDAENVPDALVRCPQRRLVVSAGRVVARDGEVLV